MWKYGTNNVKAGLYFRNRLNMEKRLDLECQIQTRTFLIRYARITLPDAPNLSCFCYVVIKSVQSSSSPWSSVGFFLG